MYLPHQKRSCRSPGSFYSPPLAEVPLPASVQDLIDTICYEQSQPPLGPDARTRLALQGEDKALLLLRTIRNSKINYSFDGFVKSRTPPTPGSSSPCTSPNSITPSLMDYSALSFAGPMKNVVTNLARDRFPVSPISAGGPSLLPCTYNRQNNEQSGPWDVSIDVQTPNAQAIVPSTAAQKHSQYTSATMLHALHQLEFRKAFMILSYIGRNKLEDVTTVEELISLGAVSTMDEFEEIIWYRFGDRYCQKKDRVKQDWESERGYYYYHCYVSSDGSYDLKGPILNMTATLPQKILGDENVLVVKFYDSKCRPVSYTHYYKVAEEGISVGLKRFRFFAYKDGDKKEKKKEKKNSSGGIKAYFVNVESFARFYQSEVSFFFDMMSIHDQRCLFMHVHNLSSLSAYMTRFSLILSKTLTLEVDLTDPDVHVEIIDDVPCTDVNGLHIYDSDGKLKIHTDGTGYISEELARRCPQNVLKGSISNAWCLERFLETLQLATTTCQLPDTFQPPLLIQFRMFYKGYAVKGTLLRNNTLPGKLIQVRKSMIKVNPDPGLPAINSLQVVSTSNRPRRACLSRNLIALLNYGGIHRDFFLGILQNEISNAHKMFLHKRAALKVAFNYGEMDDNCTVGRMICSGIPLDESYIQYRLPILGKTALTGLKSGKLPIEDSFYLMGTIDPTGSLNSNEVCIIQKTGQWEGDVLVYRAPGMHFGDLHKLKATRIKGLEDVVGNSKYGIFFPINGPRSLADKMAGGDYDGDMYFVSRHPQLLKDFIQSEPWTPAPSCSESTPFNRNPSDLTAEELERLLFQSFLNLRFQPCYSTARAAQCCSSYLDQLLSLGDDQKAKKLELQTKIVRLVDIYYESLDAPKKGKKVVVPVDLLPESYPHYMWGSVKYKGKAVKYTSTSVLGVMFDIADQVELQTPSVQVRKLPAFDIEFPQERLNLWEGYYKNYRGDMSSACQFGDNEKNDAAARVIQYYKQILYEADELEHTTKAWEYIRFDALAIYHVVYNHAMRYSDVGKLSFAWKVAGSALMQIYWERLDEKPIYCLPSVLREILNPDHNE